MAANLDLLTVAVLEGFVLERADLLVCDGLCCDIVVSVWLV
jgi:hypothetical protein